jgi:hypothetical protein
MHPRPRLTAAESAFLRVWTWEEANFQRPHTTTAKKLQVERCPYAAPQLADIVTATMTPEEQVAIAEGPAPQNTPPFPWSTDKEIQERHEEARAWLDSRFPIGSGTR